MATAKNFDAELAAVNAAADLPPGEALPILRKALTHRSNLVVSRSARHILKLQLTSLLPDLVAAFVRYNSGRNRTSPRTRPPPFGIGRQLPAMAMMNESSVL